MFHRICPVRAHHEHLFGNDEVSHLHEVLNSHSKDFPIPQSSSLRNLRFEVFWLPNGDIRNSSPFPIPQKYPFWGFLASERGSPQLVIISKSFFGGKNAQDGDEGEDDDQISFQMIYWLSLFNASPTFSVKKNFSRSRSEESSRMIFSPFVRFVVARFGLYYSPELLHPSFLQLRFEMTAASRSFTAPLKDKRLEFGRRVLWRDQAHSDASAMLLTWFVSRKNEIRLFSPFL